MPRKWRRCKEKTKEEKTRTNQISVVCPHFHSRSPWFSRAGRIQTEKTTQQGEKICKLDRAFSHTVKNSITPSRSATEPRQLFSALLYHSYLPVLLILTNVRWNNLFLHVSLTKSAPKIAEKYFFRNKQFFWFRFNIFFSQRPYF